MVVSVRQALIVSKRPTRGGGDAVVGVRTTSYEAKNAPTLRCWPVSRARAARSSGPPRRRPVRAVPRVRGSSSAGSGCRSA